MFSELDASQIIQETFDEPSSAIKVNIVGGASAGGTSQADKSSFIEGSGLATPVSATYNESLGADPSEDTAVAIRSTVKRALHTNLRNASGTEIATSSNPVRTDPTGTTTQPISGTVTANAGTGNFTVTQATGTNLHTVVDSGSITANAGTNLNTSALALSATQTDGSQKSQIVDGSGNVISSTNNALDINLNSSNIILSVDASQNGNWFSRLEDGAGNSITSSAVGTNRPLHTLELGYVNSEFARNDYSSVNVTTSAYTQLIASTANEYQEIQVFDSSGQTLKLATGAPASEVDKIIIPPGGTLPIKLRIASGTRISIKALSATANSGEIDVQFLG